MTLKKFRSWIYGVYFIIKTDIYVLVVQFNRSGTDLPGILITKQFAQIRLFDFNIRHVPRYKHTITDGLLRRSPTEINNIRIKAE